MKSDSLAKYSFKYIADTYESIRNANPEVAKTYLNELYSRANKRKEKITVFLKMGHHEILYGTREKAFSYLESAYDLVKNEESIELAYVYEKTGYYYYKERDYDKAFHHYLKALSIAEEREDKILIIKIEHKIGALNYTLGELDKALKTFNRLFKKAKTETIPYDLRISILKSLGNAYLRKYSFYKEQKELLDSSSFFSQKGLKLATLKNDQKAIAFFQYLFGISSFIKEEYSSALTHFNKFIKSQ